jgi:hypothetical protein
MPLGSSSDAPVKPGPMTSRNPGPYVVIEIGDDLPGGQMSTRHWLTQHNGRLENELTVAIPDHPCRHWQPQRRARAFVRCYFLRVFQRAAIAKVGIEVGGYVHREGFIPSPTAGGFFLL